MNPNGDRAQRFDYEMNEGYCMFERRKYGEALAHIVTAVELNPQNVFALRSCAVMYLKLGNKHDALEQRNIAAQEDGIFTRARSRGDYPFTQTSEYVFERILCQLTPRVLTDKLSSLTGDMIQIRDEVLVRRAAVSADWLVSADQLASDLPAYCQSRIETILDQVVHATVKFTPGLLRDGDENVALTLRLSSAEFGVKGHLGGKTDVLNGSPDLLGFVVRDLRIKTSPGESWNPVCTLSTVSPGDEHDVHSVQRAEGGGYQAGITVGPGAIPSGTMQLNSSQSITINSPTHGWLKSSKCTSSGNPTGWGSEWKLNTFKGGQKFPKLDYPVRKIPELPFDDPGNINYSRMHNEACHEATWKVPLTVADHLNYKFDFQITIQADIALVPRWRRRDSYGYKLSRPSPVAAVVSFRTVTEQCKFSCSVFRALFE